MSKIKKTYAYLVTLPDRLYPFSCEVEGEMVRGQRSYEQARARAEDKHGEGSLGHWLMLYRQVCHFIGSVILIFAATLFSQDLFDSNTAMYLLLGTAIVAIGYQEFYVHPREYGQETGKGVTDWLVWAVPMIAYIAYVKF